MTNFVHATLIRAIRTIAQTGIALIGSSTVLHDVDWKIVLSGALLAGLLSILTSIAAGLPETPNKGLIDPDYSGLWTKGCDSK